MGEIEFRTEFRQDLDDFLDNHWCCVYEGSIAKCEHIDYLLETFRYVNSSDIALAIVGDGGEKAALMRRAEELGLQNVRFFPEVSKQQVRALLLRAGCCVAASQPLPIYEYGLSMNKLSDYLYSGKPTVFAFGPDNMIGDAGHFSLPYGEPELMAKAIEQVRSMPQEKLQHLSSQGRRLIKTRYDYSVIGADYLKMMEGL